MAIFARLPTAVSTVILLGILTLLTENSGIAQDRGGKRPPPPAERGPRKSSSPLMALLDIDRDGELSTEEIAAAPARLRLADPNSDGLLTEEEIVEMRPSHEIQEAFDPVAFMQRCFRHDRNRDGRLTRGELPANMKRLLNSADTNRDEAISEKELETHMKAFIARFPKPRRPRN